MSVKSVKTSEAVNKSTDNQVGEFVRSKAVVVPSYSFKKRTSGFFLATAPIKVKEHTNEKGEVKTTPIMRITDLETGEECDMIVPTLLVSELNENYPDNGYVGKKFEVSVSADPKEGKLYKTVQLWELS